MIMKHIFSIITALSISIVVYAQSDVTKFLGIPVDGSRQEMTRKIKAKGFRTSPFNNDVLTGVFNGMDVNVHIATNGDKVCRVMVCDANNVDERSIQIRFNNLCRQFEKNPNYISLDDYTIPDDEDISYGISVKNKRYEAIFYQQPQELTDTVAMREKLLPLITAKFTPEQLENPTEDIQKELVSLSLEYMMELCSKKPVWFMISELYGKYYITMYYDNEYNRANGEDL